MTYGRRITWNNGASTYRVSGFEGSQEELLREMISTLIKYDSDTFKPRIKWWQVWREKMRADITDEYIKQTT